MSVEGEINRFQHVFANSNFISSQARLAVLDPLARDHCLAWQRDVLLGAVFLSFPPSKICAFYKQIMIILIYSPWFAAVSRFL